MSRYARQLALPELSQAHQDFLKNTKLLMVGAGGLGAAALPWLAGAGIGHIKIADGDTVDVTNLHRQTIFRESDAGKNKAELAAEYLRGLNPEIKVTAIAQHVSGPIGDFDIILDGTDNFETKTLLNDISIETKTPLISASVEGFKGIAAIFAGFDRNAPCYHCLFPELPTDCKTCVEGGILGTVAGLAGLWQAHLTLCFLLGIGDAKPGTLITMDFKTMRTQQLLLHKDPACAKCGRANYGAKRPMTSVPSIPVIHPNNLKNCIIVDVRNDDEVAAEPIPGALHMQLDTIPERYSELPKDKLIAFACRSNKRSMSAAQYLRALGYENVCVMDRTVAA